MVDNDVAFGRRTYEHYCTACCLAEIIIIIIIIIMINILQLNKNAKFLHSCQFCMEMVYSRKHCSLLYYYCFMYFYCLANKTKINEVKAKLIATPK